MARLGLSPVGTMRHTSIKELSLFFPLNRIERGTSRDDKNRKGETNSKLNSKFLDEKKKKLEIVDFQFNLLT